MKIIVYFIACTLLIGCKSCLKDAYAVHEKLTPIEFEIEYQEPLKKQLDSLLNQYSLVNCKKDGMKVEKKSFIICIPSNCDCFLVSNEKKHFITVYAFYSKNFNSNYWITKKEEIDKNSLEKIKKEFYKEVIGKIAKL